MIRAVAYRWGLLLAVWSAFALFAVLQIYVARLATGHVPPLWILIRLEAPIWVFWMGATVAVVMLARRFPLDRSRLAPSLGFHVVVAVGMATLFVGFRLLWYQAFNPYPLLAPSVTVWFWQYFRDSFIDGFVLYWAILGVFHALTNYALYRQRDLDAARMQAQLAESRLQTLRSQLRPHFLFNTLNTASAVLEDSPTKARSILGRLGELLRASLATDAVQEIPLAQEMAMVQAFVEIEEARFGDRLTVDVDVPMELRAALVPSFLLQPLIENAVRYGVARRPARGRVSVRATRRANQLEISVSDDGPGIPDGRVIEGIGLGNTRKRLATLYGEAQTLSLRNLPDGGLEVLIRVPYRAMVREDGGQRIAV
ncbi:MAG TPA: histidine kinase [Gemmatimonadales bacterium]